MREADADFTKGAYLMNNKNWTVIKYILFTALASILAVACLCAEMYLASCISSTIAVLCGLYLDGAKDDWEE